MIGGTAIKTGIFQHSVYIRINQFILVLEQAQLAIARICFYKVILFSQLILSRYLNSELKQKFVRSPVHFWQNSSKRIFGSSTKILIITLSTPRLFRVHMRNIATKQASLITWLVFVQSLQGFLSQI
ncbi:hypothetical protein D3C86_699070 [compost metagenome]